MKTVWIFVLVFFSAMTFLAWAGNGTTPPMQKLYRITSETDVKKPFIIKFQSPGAMERFLSQKRLPGPVIKEFRRFDMVSTAMTGGEAAELSGHRDILFVEEEGLYYLHDASSNRRLPTLLREGRHYEPSMKLQFRGVPPPAEEYQWNIQLMGAEAFHRRGFLGQGVKVAVIDTGIDHTHPDLSVAGGYKIIWYDDYDDVIGHGTHVAGIIAAKRDNFGVVGMAPEVELYSLKIFSEVGTTALSFVVDALQWSIDHEIDIVNMSFGSSVTSAALRDACKKAYDAGVLLVASAGNSGKGSTDTTGYPARYDTVISVGAVDEELEVADFSSRGADLDVVAPGVSILSTFTYPLEYEHLYYYLSGTSMACPHVVGLAALIKSVNPGISNVELKRRITDFARDLGPDGHDRNYGWGLAQLDRPEVMPDTAAPEVEAGGPYRGVVGQPVQLTASGTLDADDNFLTFDWDFGDGQQGTGPRPSHAYSKPGDYTALLTVTDGGGLSSTATASVLIRAGVEKTVRLTTTDAGYVRAPSTVSLRSMSVTAGMTSGKKNMGVMRFTTPKNGDVFILSVELDLTGSKKKPTVAEGTVTAGLLPPEISHAWPAITFDIVEGAQVSILEPSIILSYLGGQLGTGIVNAFEVPRPGLEELERQFKEGAVAFRVNLDTQKTNNSFTWAKPELVVRYLESVSTANMAPVAHAGYDRRARAETVVYLDGSASYDPESAPLQFEWVQLSGPAVSLSTSGGNPVAEFTAPAGNDILDFELRVSDGTHTALDRVKIYLNDAAAELHTVTLVPGFGNAGYVAEDWPKFNFFEKKFIIVGPIPRDKEEENPMDTSALHAGAIQFDLSSIPPGSQILSALLEITGADNGPTPHKGFDIRVMTSAIDDQWPQLNWESLSVAEVQTTLRPHISTKDVNLDRVNRLKIDPALLDSRRVATGKITFRIDGPKILAHWYDSFWWWSGNEGATRDKTPRLVITYGARDPVSDPEP